MKGMTKVSKWSPTPHLHSRSCTQQIMYEFTAILLIITFYSSGVFFYLDGDQEGLKVIWMVLTSIGAAVVTDTCFFLGTRQVNNFYEGLNVIIKSYSFITAILFALCLPIGTPLVIVALGSALSVFLGKQVFGGLGMNPFNPALVGRAIVTISWGSFLTTTLSNEVDAISSSTPLMNLASYQGIGTYEQLVEPYGGWFGMLVGTYEGAIGETASLVIVLGGIYLMIRKIIDWRIPVFYLGTVFVMTWIIGAVNGISGIWYPIFHLLSGGLLFGAMFMATDLVTSPVSRRGKILFSLGLGLLTVIIRLLGNYPEGVFFSILFMNLMTFPIDRYFMGQMNEPMKRSEVISWLVMTSLIVFTALMIGFILG